MCKEEKHEHKHSHKGHHHSHSTNRENIKVAFLLNLMFSIIEVFGGLLTNSSAILSDAIHDFGDSLSLGLAMIFDKKSKKKANNDYTYGYKRLSVISAIINLLVLSIGTVFVFKEAIERLLAPQVVMANGMFALAILGIIINGISVLRMKGSSKISEKAVMLHLLEDLFGWIAVFVVSIVLLFTEFYILDPILSLIICFIMIRNIIYNLKSLYKIIMQSTPEDINIDDIKKELLSIIKDCSIEEIRIWSLDGDSHIASLKISLKEDISIKGTEEMKLEIISILNNYNVIDTTIEFSLFYI